MTNAVKNAMMAALRTEGYYFDEDKLYVTERFHKAASQFGSVQYKKIMDMLCKPNMKKLVKKHRRGKLEKYLSNQYEKEYGNGKPQTENFFIPE
jgi:hypothetical protein